MKNLSHFLILAIFTIAITITVLKTVEPVGQILEEVEIAQDIDDVVEIIPVEEYINGVFVTTIYNLDFPTNQNLTEAELKTEIDDIIGNVKNAQMTDIFLQVRPCADAFYFSELFPTSIYLTGSQDKEASFDVLEYYIEKCHENDIKLHAWINPYRITKSSSDVLSSTHIAVTNPELTVLHTDGNLYFNPALEQAQDYIVAGVQEIIENYDVDGIHFDDYFYPSTTFDDSDSYELLGNGRSLDQFRRDSITSLIEKTNDLINEKAPDVMFGISPSGVWANDTDVLYGSATSAVGSYQNQYADTKSWVENGILDYIAPQIYWYIGFEAAEYITLVDWWSDVCQDTDVKLYVCHASYKEVEGDFEQGEIERQVQYNQEKGTVSGSIFFRYSYLF